jgi:trimethylamine--corrinoid protein Co-methyltransferase
MAMLESMAGKMRNSTKPLSEGYANDCEIFTIQMAQAVASEMLVPCLPAAPLTYYGDAIEAALRGSEAGFPVKLATGVVPGATAPATMAGAIVSASAELIPPIVLLQHVSPGTRIVVSDLIFPQNMRTGCPAFGAIGSSLCTAGFNQIWRSYGVPTSNTATPSSSKMIDFQCGYEKATSALLFTLSGGSLLQFHGGLHGELTHHPLQAILDDDVAAMIGRFLEGISVNHEMLAVDLINEVGPIPSHFLNQEHTRNWWRQEQFLPKAADRLTYPEWMNSRKKSCLDYARERMDEILATHRPVPLTTRQEEDVERILKDARQYYRERGSISDDEMAVYRRSMTSADYPYQ